MLKTGMDLYGPRLTERKEKAPSPEGNEGLRSPSPGSGTWRRPDLGIQSVLVLFCTS